MHNSLYTRRELLGGAAAVVSAAAAAALLSACSGETPDTPKTLPSQSVVPAPTDVPQNNAHRSRSDFYLPSWVKYGDLPLPDRAIVSFALPTNTSERITEVPTSSNFRRTLKNLGDSELLVSVGGWGYGDEAPWSHQAILDGWEAAMEHPVKFAKRLRAVRFLIAEAAGQDEGGVGVDIDAEDLQSKDRSRFTDLILETSATLPNAPLTLAVPTRKHAKFIDPDKIADELATVNVMAYAYQLPEQKSIEQAISDIEHWTNQFGPEKIAVGLTNDPDDPLSQRSAQQAILEAIDNKGIRPSRFFAWDASRDMSGLDLF